MVVTYLVEALVGLATLAAGAPLLRRSRALGGFLVFAGVAAIAHAAVALVG
ncbi:MAG: hypothetical protein ACKOI0_04975 [Actinomycetota bacterium]